MRPDTPLTEVATHLPLPAAQILDEMAEDVQEYVLSQMRRVIVWWEEQGYVLDPVSYEAVLTALVACLTPQAEEIRRAARTIATLAIENDELRANLTAAGALIEHLSKPSEKPKSRWRTS